MLRLFSINPGSNEDNNGQLYPMPVTNAFLAKHQIFNIFSIRSWKRSVKQIRINSV